MSTRPASTAVTFVPALFIFIWSSGYVVAKFGLPYAEPLTFLCWRYVGVIALMLGLAILAGAHWPRSPVAYFHAGVAGVLMQAIYLGGVWGAIHLGMPAGVAALIVNTQPILTAIFSRAAGERVTVRQWIGLACGFAGVALVVSNKLTTVGMGALPLGLAVFALFGMTIGTLYQKRFSPSIDIRVAQVVQFAAALVTTLPFALVLETNVVELTPRFLMAYGWSVFVLSGGGITLLFFMIRRGSATAVTSYLYLVPPVTAIMAWLMFHERLGPRALLGMAVTAAAVALVVVRPNRDAARMRQ